MRRRPGYVALHERGELATRAALLREMLADCRLCGHRCGADRREGPGRAFCRTGPVARVASHGPHHGEEPPISGFFGSGTIFFSRCNLACAYCQNWTISQADEGTDVTPHELAGMMLALQARGCHNVNLVSPTHVAPMIVDALVIAAARGLEIPLVWNSGGYDSVELLRLLDGIVDIYLPDVKYAEERAALAFSAAPRYPRVALAAVAEMHQQVGPLEVDPHGIAVRGVLVRHLVLPGGLAGTGDLARRLAGEIGPGVVVHVMDQYRPAWRAARRPPLDRRPSAAELAAAREAAARHVRLLEDTAPPPGS